MVLVVIVHFCVSDNIYLKPGGRRDLRTEPVDRGEDRGGDQQGRSHLWVLFLLREP